jgi:hypothetical protein
MGTMDGWEGSGGRWNRVRDLSADLADQPGTPDLDELIDALVDALGDTAPTDVAASPMTVPIATPLPSGISWSRGARGTGGGGGGGGAGGGTGGGGGGGRGGGRRSRARAAGIGGGVLSAALAYRAEDADTLATLGLDLEELRSLAALQRNNAILNALVGADGGVEEAELRRVNGRVLTRVFKEDLDAADAVRAYIVEYAVQVWAGETGQRQRADSNRVHSSRQLERQLRGALAIRVRQVEISPGAGAEGLRSAIESALSLMHTLTEGL